MGVATQVFQALQALQNHTKFVFKCTNQMVGECHVGLHAELEGKSNNGRFSVPQADSLNEDNVRSDWVMLG